MRNLLRRMSLENKKRLLEDDEVGFHYGQSGEDVILWRMLKRKKNGFYVDVGAHHPRKYSNTHMLYWYLNWSGINIDTTKEAILTFEKERPRDVNLCLAVSDRKEDVVLALYEGGARNSLDPETQARQRVEVIERRTVQTTTLAEILREHVPAEQSVDLLNIDVEGFDLKVLRSNDWDQYRPEFVLVEDHQYRRSGETTEIYKYMTKLKYRRVSHALDTSIFKSA